MSATRSVILAAFFLATLLAATPPKFLDPPNPCLMLPRTTGGQASGVRRGYEPRTCVT